MPSSQHAPPTSTRLLNIHAHAVDNCPPTHATGHRCRALLRKPDNTHSSTPAAAEACCSTHMANANSPARWQALPQQWWCWSRPCQQGYLCITASHRPRGAVGGHGPSCGLLCCADMWPGCCRMPAADQTQPPGSSTKAQNWGVRRGTLLFLPRNSATSCCTTACHGSEARFSAGASHACQAQAPPAALKHQQAHDSQVHHSKHHALLIVQHTHAAAVAHPEGTPLQVPAHSTAQHSMHRVFVNRSLFERVWRKGTTLRGCCIRHVLTHACWQLGMLAASCASRHY